MRHIVGKGKGARRERPATTLRLTAPRAQTRRFRAGARPCVSFVTGADRPLRRRRDSAILNNRKAYPWRTPNLLMGLP